MNGENIRNVYISGYCPEWLSDEVVKVPVENVIKNPQNIFEKHINILNCVLYTIDNTDIEDEFLVSMDDHYYVRTTDFDNYPYYAKKVGLFSKHKNYDALLKKTESFLNDKNLSKINFTLHRNMHCKKDIIRRCCDEYPELKTIGIEPWLVFLNYQYTKEGFEFEYTDDVKIYNGGQWWKASPYNTHVMSTNDFDLESGLHVMLKNTFNKKSKYEI